MARPSGPHNTDTVYYPSHPQPQGPSTYNNPLQHQQQQQQQQQQHHIYNQPTYHSPVSYHNPSPRHPQPHSTSTLPDLPPVRKRPKHDFDDDDPPTAFRSIPPFSSAQYPGPSSTSQTQLVANSLQLNDATSGPSRRGTDLSGQLYAHPHGYSRPAALSNYDNQPYPQLYHDPSSTPSPVSPYARPAGQPLTSNFHPPSSKRHSSIHTSLSHTGPLPPQSPVDTRSTFRTPAPASGAAAPSTASAVPGKLPAPSQAPTGGDSTSASSGAGTINGTVPSATLGTTAVSKASSGDGPAILGGSGAGGTTAGLVQGPKVRSTIACSLCRRQKMKCEGPEAAPCKRCRQAGVECVFENVPTGRTSTKSTAREASSVNARRESVAASTLRALTQQGESKPLLHGSLGGGIVTQPEPRRSTALERRITALENNRVSSLEHRVADLEAKLEYYSNLATSASPPISTAYFSRANHLPPPYIPTPSSLSASTSTQPELGSAEGPFASSWSVSAEQSRPDDSYSRLPPPPPPPPPPASSAPPAPRGRSAKMSMSGSFLLNPANAGPRRLSLSSADEDAEGEADVDVDVEGQEGDAGGRSDAEDQHQMQVPFDGPLKRKRKESPMAGGGAAASSSDDGHGAGDGYNERRDREAIEQGGTRDEGEDQYRHPGRPSSDRAPSTIGRSPTDLSRHPSLRYPRPSSSVDRPSSSAIDYKRDPDDLIDRTARTTGRGREPDFIVRGLVTEHQARDLFTAYLDKCAERIMWLDVPCSFEVIRSHSMLLLAALLCTGARASGDMGIYRTILEEAKRLARRTMFPTGDRLNVGDQQGLLILTLYHGLTSLIGHTVSVAYDLGLHAVFAKLTDPLLRGRSDEASLLEGGRCYLATYVYSHLYSLYSGKPYLMHTPERLILQQCEIIQRSHYTRPMVDVAMTANVEMVGILGRVQDELDPSQRVGPKDDTKTVEAVTRFSDELDRWYERWRDSDLVAQVRKKGGDGLIFDTPYHSSRLYIHNFAVSPARDGNHILADHRLLNSAQIATESAKTLLTNAMASPTFRRQAIFMIDYDLAAMGLAIQWLFTICLLLPRQVDFLGIRKMLSQVMTLLAETTPTTDYLKPIRSLMLKLDAFYKAIQHETKQNAERSRRARTSSGIADSSRSTSLGLQDTSHSATPATDFGSVPTNPPSLATPTMSFARAPPSMATGMVAGPSSEMGGGGSMTSASGSGLDAFGGNMGTFAAEGQVIDFASEISLAELLGDVESWTQLFGGVGTGEQEAGMELDMGMGMGSDMG